MGVCASKMKEVAGGIDKEAIEMGVKGRKVEIATKSKALATQWQTDVANGQTVRVSPAELLPQKDLSKARLQMDAQTTAKEMLITALYVTTNTIWRDQAKKEIWADLAAGMKARNMPAPVIQHGEKGAGPAVDMALDKQIAQMVELIETDKPLVAEEEMKAVAAYNEKKLAANPNAKQATDLNAKPDITADPNQVYLQDKEAAGADGRMNQRGSYEQAQPIRA